MDKIKFDFSSDLESAVKLTPVKEKPKDGKKLKEYSSLPVYKAAVDAIRLLFNSTLKAPMFVKTGLLKDIQSDLIWIIYLIRVASESKDKAIILQNAFEKAQYVQTAIRVFYDLGLMSRNGFAATSSKSEDLVRLLCGWLKSCKQ